MKKTIRKLLDCFVFLLGGITKDDFCAMLKRKNLKIKKLSNEIDKLKRRLEGQSCEFATFTIDTSKLEADKQVKLNNGLIPYGEFQERRKFDETALF